MPTLRTTLSILIAVFIMQAGIAQTQTPSSADVEKRVDALVSQMTLDEKINLIGGTDGFFTRPIPRLGVPSLKMSDGPLGVHDYGTTTAYAAGIDLAASWDSDLARRVGESMGRDARARGVNFVLAPGMNIYRAPMNGRNFEYFGEDPYLASRTAVSLIEGMQSENVIATAKHFAANNMEYGRSGSQFGRRRTDPARNLSARVRSVREGGARRSHYGRVQPRQRRAYDSKRTPQ